MNFNYPLNKLVPQRGRPKARGVTPQTDIHKRCKHDGPVAYFYFMSGRNQERESLPSRPLPNRLSTSKAFRSPSSGGITPDNEKYGGVGHNV